MGKTGIIMGVFFVTAATFSVLENQRHREQAALPQPMQPITESITDPLPDKIPDFVHDETRVSLQPNPARELQQALKLEQQEIGKLKDIQQSLDRQLLAVYQKNQQIERLEAQNQQHVIQSDRLRATRSVDQALRDWAEHDAEINRLAVKNSSMRQYYLPEEESEGYALNKAMTAKRKAQDKQRAAVDARIRYLNEVYQRQQKYYRARIRSRAYQRGAPLPVYQ